MAPDTTPIGFLHVAESFRRAAMLLATDLRGSSFDGSPIRFNYYHAIELYLKAALVADGVSEADLKDKLRHGFGKLAAEANRRGLGLPDADLATVEMIDFDGNYLRSRYHRTGYFRVATVQSLDATAFECASLVVDFLRVRFPLVRVRPPADPLPGAPTDVPY